MCVHDARLPLAAAAATATAAGALMAKVGLGRGGRAPQGFFSSMDEVLGKLGTQVRPYWVAAAAAAAAAAVADMKRNECEAFLAVLPHADICSK